MQHCIHPRPQSLGQGEHAKNTWTHSNGVLWPRDLLPRDIPTARILLFSYNSNVTFNVASGTLRDYAIALLERLRNKRNQPVLQTNPFVGGMTDWQQ